MTSRASQQTLPGMNEVDLNKSTRGNTRQFDCAAVARLTAKDYVDVSNLTGLVRDYGRSRGWWSDWKADMNLAGWLLVPAPIFKRCLICGEKAPDKKEISDNMELGI